MAKMIDGVKLVENLRLIAKCWSVSPFVSKEKHNGAVNMLREVEREVKEAPTLTPQNEALTLGQLRQMEGQWIIIKAFDAEISGIMPAFIKDQFATTLCELGSKAIIPDLCEAHFSFSEYGKTWIAYDRPPEGEEDT